MITIVIILYIIIFVILNINYYAILINNTSNITSYPLIISVIATNLPIKITNSKASYVRASPP